MSGPMSDEELVGYAELHCRTDRALFSREQLTRLYQLAGQPVPLAVERHEWITAREKTILPLVDEIRAEIRAEMPTKKPVTVAQKYTPGRDCARCGLRFHPVACTCCDAATPDCGCVRTERDSSDRLVVIPVRCADCTKQGCRYLSRRCGNGRPAKLPGF